LRGPKERKSFEALAMSSEFDSYVAVDWSANNKPKNGPDSVWWCEIRADGKRQGPHNPSTRANAIRQIRAALIESVNAGLHALVGFDFPYGYPANFAQALGLDRAGDGEPWIKTWKLIARLMQDDDHNRNNRFEVAAMLNQRVSSAAFPFWGCPKSGESTYLSARSCWPRDGTVLREKRICEGQVRGPQAVWKLFTAGSVGSQALTGIPRVLQLRHDIQLKSVSAVWPFETGLNPLPTRAQRPWKILHAEIYPSIIPLRSFANMVKDAAQVCTLATWFAELDREGELDRLFSGPPTVPNQQRHTIECEEGWILFCAGAAFVRAMQLVSLRATSEMMTRCSFTKRRSKSKASAPVRSG